MLVWLCHSLQLLYLLNVNTGDGPMSFIDTKHYKEPFMENDDMDIEIEFYNVPDTRIIDMINEVYFESDQV